MSSINAQDEKRPRVELLGQDGNAFNIMGLCHKAARKAGWTKEKIEAVMKEMKSGDYDHLLQVALTHFDVR